MRPVRYALLAVLTLSAMSAKSPAKTRHTPHEKTYSVHLAADAKAGDVTLPRGDYRLAVESSKAIFTGVRDHNRLEVPATVQTANKKFPTTMIAIRTADGTQKLEEIDIGGTTTRVQFQ